MAAALTVKILPISNPPGKLADAELHFTDGPLVGLKLIGFGIWERRGGTGRNVTFPARQYSINGERRSFALLRPTGDTTAHDTIRQLILDAYTAHEAADAASPTATYARDVSQAIATAAPLAEAPYALTRDAATTTPVQPSLIQK